MTPDQLNAIFTESAELCREATKHIMNIDLAYDAPSLLKMDEIISAAWPERPEGDISKRCELWGSYLGECLRRVHNGRWVNTGSGWGVEIGDVVLNVFAKIEKRFVNGMDDSITFFYKAFKNQLNTPNP
jgi:hypothetical protein